VPDNAADYWGIWNDQANFRLIIFAEEQSIIRHALHPHTKEQGMPKRSFLQDCNEFQFE
jgi:hypothetical protein